MSRVFLRALEPEDFELIYRWHHDEKMTSQLSGNVYFISKARERKWTEEKSLDDQKSLYLGICLSELGEMIGYLSMSDIDLRNRKAEWTGLVIGKEELWSKGYGTEAAALMLEYGFGQMNLHRIYGYCLEEHASSIRMFEKLGFKKEGVLRDSVFRTHKYRNQILLSLLQDEYRSKLEE
jgi:ribosomal-protein-alanine N-acetyltransferase